MQSPLETPVQRLRNTRLVEEICAMDQDRHSISPQDLYARLGSDAAPIVIDVRREADFADADRLVVPALHRTPDNVEQWQKDLHGGGGGCFFFSSVSPPP